MGHAKAAAIRMVSVVAILLPIVGVMPRAATAAGATVTYSATETIPVPPASAYAGSAGGDGWGIALSNTDVYNVFHHQSTLEVACHLQSNASDCWSPETITDTSGNNFATSGQPGLWLNSGSGDLYVYATRVSDSTAGVVCIDTTLAETNPDPFCGFTALSAVGDAPLVSGISGVSDPVLVGTSWYAFNYVNGTPTGTQDKLLCFDVQTQSACGLQPFSVALGAGAVSDLGFPSPSIAVFSNQIVVPISFGNFASSEIACFDAASAGPCAGSWPVSTTANGYPESSNAGNGGGAPFALLSSGGSTTGLCIAVSGDPCWSLSGSTVTSPPGLASVVLPNAGWDGTSLTLGPRVYVPDGNFSGSDAVACFDYSTGASCTNFPKTFSNLALLYTVNPDPQRPTCIWVNSDYGADQIQNFDAYTGAACGQGPIRVLASSLVAPTQLCIPTTYTSIQVLSPPPGSYTTGTVAFEDGDGNPIAGIPTENLDPTGTAGLSGLNLNTAQGLPQFLITLNGASGTPTSVQVKLTWAGVADPSCIPGGAPPPTSTLTVSPFPLDEIVDRTYTGNVALVIVHQAATVTPSDLSATIDWGDGVISAGTVVAAPPAIQSAVGAGAFAFVVQGTNTYYSDLNSTFSVNIQGPGTDSGSGSAPVIIDPLKPTAFFTANPTNPVQDGIGLFVPEAAQPGQLPIVSYKWQILDGNPVIDSPSTDPIYESVLSQLQQDPGNGILRTQAIALGILPTDANGGPFGIGGLSADQVRQVVGVWQAYFPYHIVPHLFDFYGAVGVGLTVVDKAGHQSSQYTQNYSVSRDCLPWGGPLSKWFGGYTVCDTYNGIAAQFGPKRGPDYLSVSLSGIPGLSGDTLGIGFGLSLTVIPRLLFTDPANAAFVSIQAQVGVGTPGNSLNISQGWLGPPDPNNYPNNAEDIASFVDGTDLFGGFAAGLFGLGLGFTALENPSTGQAGEEDSYNLTSNPGVSASAGAGATCAFSLGTISSQVAQNLQTFYNGWYQNPGNANNGQLQNAVGAVVNSIGLSAILNTAGNAISNCRL